MAQPKEDRTPIVRKSSKGVTFRCGSSKIRYIDQKNMVVLSDNVMAHLDLEVGDTVSYIPTDDGNIIMKKAASKGSSGRKCSGGNTAGRGRAGGAF